MIYFYAFVLCRAIEFVITHYKNKVVFSRELEQRMQHFNVFTGTYEERKTATFERAHKTQQLIYKLEEREKDYFLWINISRYLQFFFICFLFIELYEIKLPLW